MVATAAGIAAFASVVLDCGTSTRAARAASLADHPVEVQSAIRWRLIAGVAISVAYGASITCQWLGFLQTAGLHVAFGVLVWAWLISVQILLSGLLIAASCILLGAGLLIFDKLVSLVVLAILIDQHAPFQLVVLAFPIGLLASIVPAAFATRHAIGVALRARGRKDRQWLPEQLSFSGSALGAQAQNLAVPIVTWLAGPEQGGLLGIPARLAGPISLVAASVSSVLLVRKGLESRATGGHGPASSGEDNAVARLAVAAGCVTTIFVAPLILFPETTMTILLGEAYEGAGQSASLVGVAMCISAFGQPLAADLQARFRHMVVALIILGSGGAGLALVLVAAPSWGATAGALGMLLSQSSAVLALVVSWRGAASRPDVMESVGR
jgi:hypothetical protein